MARVPVFVDITAAEADMAARQQANEQSASMSADLESRIEALEQDNRAEQDKLARAEELLGELSVSRGELYGARNRAIDPGQKEPGGRPA